MKDNTEILKSPEREIIKPRERKIETYDDLRSNDRPEEIETYDDIQKRESDTTIKTYDDIARAKETGEEKSFEAEKTEKARIDTPESLEQRRLSQAAEGIGKIEWMKPEKWKNLDLVEKRTALSHVGKVLSEVYHHPNPPLFTEKAAPNKLGDYGDGWAYNKTAGSDYGIRMNEDGINQMNKKLFGDDPRAALETYCHEFRHSYQCEQAHAFDQGLYVNDPEKAKEWSGNLGENYKPAPERELAKTDPGEYRRKYEEYENQPVEKDAREFANKISSRIYGDIEKRQ